MTNSFRCDDKALLVSYLYGEVSAADRAAVESHVATCAACADELATLGAVRADSRDGSRRRPTSDSRS